MNSYAAFRSAAEIPDYDYEPPEVRVLWNKTPIARRPHLCCICDEEIALGERYESVGVLIDGDFQATKQHLRSVPHVSGCPRFAARDKAEAAAQFEADRERYFPDDAEPADAEGHTHVSKGGSPILPYTLSGGGEEDQGAASPRDHTIEPRQAAIDQGGGAE